MLAGSDLRYVGRLFYRFARHVWSGSWQPSTDAQHQANLQLHHEFRLFDKIPLIVIDINIKQVCISTIRWNRGAANFKYK
jgi:hypothetical protein